MNKKVLVLSGSPRKDGNSDLLCDQFVRGATEAGHRVEKIRVQEQKIGYCIDCAYCRSHGGQCALQDGMATVLQKMIDADVIVMATPVYFYSMDAQMKALIDRCVARYVEMKNKEFYFILSAAVEDASKLERTVECFRGFTDCLENPVEKGIIYGVGAWMPGDIREKPTMQQAYDMGHAV